MTTGSQTQAPPAADIPDIPVEEPKLNWEDIRRLLQEKLTSESFTKTLRYSQDHEHVPLSDIRTRPPPTGQKWNYMSNCNSYIRELDVQIFLVWMWDGCGWMWDETDLK